MYFDTYVNRCLEKSHSKIKRLCTPLEELLDIPVFSYFYLGSDGSYCNVSNVLEETEYYYNKHIYAHDPYVCHPRFFHSKYAIVQITSDEHIRTEVQNRYQLQNFFQIIYKQDDSIDGFLFARRNKSYTDSLYLFEEIYLLEKFALYFKIEAKSIIRNILGQGYNMKSALGSAFESPTSHTLKTVSKERLSFFKQINLLSQRENECVDLYKQGHSAQTTGAKLGLSQRTVEHYLDSARHKLGFVSKRQFLEI